MVAMREDAGGREKRRGRQTEVASVMPSKEHVEAVLGACIKEVTHALLLGVKKQREGRSLLADDAWLFVLRHALFEVIKVSNFHDFNREGSEEDAMGRIKAYDDYADEFIGPDFIRLCQSLHKWREGQQKPDTGSKG